MIIFEILKFAFVSLWANKFRSILTMLGIIIGIFSVVILSAAGSGVKAQVTEFINGLGPNTLIVIPVPSIEGQQPAFQQSASFLSTITSADADAIEDQVKNVSTVQKAAFPSGIASYKDKKIIPFMFGASPDIVKVFKMEVVKGENITDDDADGKKKVAVLGDSIRTQLDLNLDDIGATIKVGKDDFKVIGFFAPTTSQMYGLDLGTIIFMPVTTAQQLNGRTTLDRLFITASSAETVEQVSSDINSLLKDRHGESDFSVLQQKDALKLFDQILGILTALLSAIASISLLVGGIGIMNIMLVSVTERTKEIGIRKAIGATNGMIMLQFLIEAVLLTVIGAGIAVAGAYAVVPVISAKSPITPIIEVKTIFLAVGISAIIGIVFGLFPAARAARKNPIEALRYE